MQYKLHLNLQQRAALRTAISFWENKEVQDRVSKFFESWNAFKSNYTAREKWYKLTKTLIDEWNKALLPQRVEAELIHITKMIGKTIFNWCLYIKREYKMKEMNLVDNIYWTPYGTIDEVQILKSSWLTNPDLDITKVYNFACRYALVDCIDDLWHKIPTDIQNKDSDDIYMHFDQHILAYWKHCRNGDLHNLMIYLETFAERFSRQDREVFNLIYDLDRSTEENMLRLSVHQGYYMAVKYFWEKLTEEEKDQSVLKCARITVKRYTDFEKNQGGYQKSQYVKICLFFMNQMTKGNKKEFFNTGMLLPRDCNALEKRWDIKDEILQMLLFTWPCQELFMFVLKDMVEYADENSNVACTFLDDITYEMLQDYKLGYFMDTNSYRSLLRKAWLILSESIKQKMSQVSRRSNFVDNLSFIRDLDSLKLILNDPAIANFSYKFVPFGSYSYNRLIEENEFEFVDRIMNEFLKSEEQKKNIRQRICCWYTFMIENNFHLADKLLNWRCSTPEEKRAAKNEVDTMEVLTELFLMDNYDVVNKFLDWRFDTKEERKNDKDYFRSTDYSIWRICDMWELCKNDIDEAKKRSIRFLRWLVESDEESVIARYHKETLLNSEMDEPTVYCLIELYDYGILDDYLTWCLSDDHAGIERIKGYVLEEKLLR